MSQLGNSPSDWEALLFGKDARVGKEQEGA